MLDAREVFDGLTQHDQVSWTSMISGLSRNGDRKGALLMFKRMLVSSVKPNCQTFVGVMSGKTGPEEALVNATMLHAQIVKRGFESNSFLISTLVDVYSKCGRLGQAEVLFYDTEEKEEVLFNPMISGYCFNARYEKGLRLFAEMRERNLSPSYHAVTSALHACGSITLLQQGREIHALLIKLGSEFNIYVVSALVDMYSKCGSVEEARRAFDQTVEKNAVMWTSMILGYAQNGKGLNALELFKIWKKECDFRPDHVSFTAVLSACVHSGLVEKGLEYFGMFKNVYGIVPDQDHYACLVDLYARNGQLEKAKELMETMPQKPNHFMWSSFLSSCRDYGEIEIAKKTADKILLTETRDASSYIVLANLYASAGLWGEAAEVTRSMNEHKIKKNVSAGSWV
ncbi:PREDICTED: pentatricopeptide repeat-containing protein At4g37170-like isoform X2 [Tarenaya hassleriana]|nr:PREDICTED: pentatricopeptide repeat-containing protein At4g37170-like isoform X2 [Tarenaya hassleriana]